MVHDAIRYLTAATVLAAATAAAGQTSNTTCTGMGNFVNCTTTREQQPDYSGVATLGRMFREKKERKRAEKAAAAQAALVQAIVEKVRGGDCASGKEMALSSGNFELATQVSQYCAANGQ